MFDFHICIHSQVELEIRKMQVYLMITIEISLPTSFPGTELFIMLINACTEDLLILVYKNA